MPILNVKLCAAPSADISGRVAAALTDLTVDILGKKRELTAVAVDQVSPSDWFIGGAPLSAGALATFHLAIKITEGTNTKDEKARYVERAFAAVEGILGPLAPASYIVIDDVRADSWGYQGRTQEERYVRGKTI